MTDQIAFPPLHDLPSDELKTRRKHLLNEITREPETRRRSLPTFAVSRLGAVANSSAVAGFAHRRVLVAAVALAAALAAGLFAATWSPQADALPAPFQAAQSTLDSQFHIHVNPLDSTAQVALSEQQAEHAAVAHYQSAPTGVTATLVSATDDYYQTSASDGTLTRVISNQAAWLVLVPGQQAPIFYPKGKSGPASYSVTSAVLVDANTGAVLIEVELPR
jgi:hypothetical protein